MELSKSRRLLYVSFLPFFNVGFVVSVFCLFEVDSFGVHIIRGSCPNRLRSEREWCGDISCRLLKSAYR